MISLKHIAKSIDDHSEQNTSELSGSSCKGNSGGKFRETLAKYKNRSSSGTNGTKSESTIVSLGHISATHTANEPVQIVGVENQIPKPTVIRLGHILTTTEPGESDSFVEHKLSISSTANSKKESSLVSLGHIISTKDIDKQNIKQETVKSEIKKQPEEVVRVRPNSNFLTRFVGSRERFNDSIADPVIVAEDIQLTCKIILYLFPTNRHSWR